MKPDYDNNLRHCPEIYVSVYFNIKMYVRIFVYTAKTILDFALYANYIYRADV